MKKNKLIKSLERKYELAHKRRIAKNEAERPFKERISVIFSAPRYITTDFWCSACKKDCSGTGYRQVCTIRPQFPTAWFTGYCPLGHKMIRRITDKGSDPYYDSSHMIQRQRYEMRDALLTPDDPRFKEIYPKQFEELFGKKK